MNDSETRRYVQFLPLTTWPLYLLAVLVLAFSVSTAWAGDKDKDSAKDATKPVKVEQPYVKSKGKPADPGAHGRANAAAKQAANPGKGSNKSGDLEITPLTGKSNGKKEKNRNQKEGGRS